MLKKKDYFNDVEIENSVEGDQNNFTLITDL